MPGRLSNTIPGAILSGTNTLSTLGVTYLSGPFSRKISKKGKKTDRAKSSSGGWLA
jgi:hypothetical protein